MTAQGMQLREDAGTAAEGVALQPGGEAMRHPLVRWWIGEVDRFGEGVDAFAARVDASMARIDAVLTDYRRIG